MPENLLAARRQPSLLEASVRRQFLVRQISMRAAAPHRAPLKDGRTAVIRKLTTLDQDKLNDFLDRAGFLGPGGAFAYQAMGKAAARQHELAQIFGSLADAGYGMLVAEVDGRIEGLCGFEPLHALDAPDAGLAGFPPFQDLHACVSTLSVTPDAQGIGIGSALKTIQKQWAAQAGYQAIVAETHPANQAMLRIVAGLGGSVVAEGAGPARTIIPLQPGRDREA